MPNRVDHQEREPVGPMWPYFATGVLEHLTEDDAPDLWQVALDTIFTDAAFLCRRGDHSKSVVAEVGGCSHWLRPHQTRWPADGGFAWPTGYGGGGFSRLGLPEFDWSITRTWNAATGTWEPVGRTGDRLTFRVALPTRTARHLQAAVHTLWTPGTPVRPKQKSLQFYGFRKSQGEWRCTAHRGGDKSYERAGEGDG